jgi:hypothetical protein
MVNTVATWSQDERTVRYRKAENALCDHYGLHPAARLVELRNPATHIRVLEVGSCEPVLFVHGTFGPGGWPALISKLSAYRCLVLDRPWLGIQLVRRLLS